jgi:hypothetical protein
MENTTINEKYLKNQARFGFTVLNKFRKNTKVSAAIEQYLEKFGITSLPPTRKEFLKYEAAYYQFDAYDEALKDKLDLLVSFYYSIKTTKGYYAYFEQENQKKLVPLAFWYSKHRLCAIWNWRKSQIIRQKYFDFLSVAKDDYNVLLIKKYIPIHLVLTVNHSEGMYKGKEFYASEVIQSFNKMRKTETWKKYVYGGEYGVEVKKSKTHGLHIHIHSFLLQNPNYSINEARFNIIREWAKITENKPVTDYILDFEEQNKTDFSIDKKSVYDLFFKQLQTTKAIYTGIGYESLYTIKEGKKQYINPKKSTIEDFLAGVMECIKYHFKPDCLETTNGEIDVELIENILNNTKGKNLYNRFGAFRKEENLNFNKTEKVEITDNEELNIEDNVNSSVDNVEEKVINPFTFKPSEGEYKIVVTSPNSIKYLTGDSIIPYQGFVFNTNFLRFAPDSLTLKEVIKLDVQGKLFMQDDLMQLDEKIKIEEKLHHSIKIKDNEVDVKEVFRKSKHTNYTRKGITGKIVKEKSFEERFFEAQMAVLFGAGVEAKEIKF